MVESILKDKKRHPQRYLRREYGYHDLFIGLPAVLGGMAWNGSSNLS